MANDRNKRSVSGIDRRLIFHSFGFRREQASLQVGSVGVRLDMPALLEEEDVREMRVGLARSPRWGEGFPQRGRGAWRCGVVGCPPATDSGPDATREDRVQVHVDWERVGATRVQIAEGQVDEAWLAEWRSQPGVIVTYLDEGETRTVLLGRGAPRGAPSASEDQDTDIDQSKGPDQDQVVNGEEADRILLALPPVLTCAWLKSASFSGGPVPVMEEHYVFGAQRATHGMAVAPGMRTRCVGCVGGGSERDQGECEDESSEGACESLDGWGFQSYIMTPQERDRGDDDALPAVGSVSNLLDWQPCEGGWSSPAGASSSNGRDSVLGPAECEALDP